MTSTPSCPSEVSDFRFWASRLSFPDASDVSQKLFGPRARAREGLVLRDRPATQKVKCELASGVGRRRIAEVNVSKSVSV